MKTFNEFTREICNGRSPNTCWCMKPTSHTKCVVGQAIREAMITFAERRDSRFHPIFHSLIYETFSAMVEEAREELT